MFRSVALALVLTSAAFAAHGTSTAPPPQPSLAEITGVVADATGAIVPNAEIDLLDTNGTVAGTYHSGGDGSFQVKAPHAGSYTLVVSEPGFDTIKTPVVIAAPVAATSAAAPSGLRAAPLRITLPIAAISTNVRVNADTDEDLTSGDENHDSSVMTSQDLKALPIFDNDYQGAMSAFLDDSATATGGSGLIVDGMEANRATVSASAVQEVRINQDPYSAQYYWPGRGQMEIVTKSAADHYHGQANFYFRDSAMNAQNALAPTKPFEQRRIYEGSVTGPIFFAPKSSFLGSFNRAEEDLNGVVHAYVAPTPENPAGIYSANVPAPTRDTEFSIRAAHQFNDRHSAYGQYSYQDWTGKNQGVGGQSLAEAGYNNEYHEDDLVTHVDSTLSSVLLNQFSVVGEHDFSHNTNSHEASRVYVTGAFTGGSAQNDALSTEYNFRLFDVMQWMHGKHFVKYGLGIPHLSRRAFDDHTNELGSYVFSPTLTADGVTVLQSALQNYEANLPSAYSQNSGDTHFVYHQQEMGAFIQDQYKVTARFSITPGLRYDWQNFLAEKRLGFSPRVSFAYVIDPESKTVLRGGGGIYYDRFGSGPLLDLVRYEGVQPRRRSVTLSLNPAAMPPTGCVPIGNCVDVASQPVARVQLAPDARLPYQYEYGVSIERQLGEKATGTASFHSMREIGEFRSLDINAPTPESGYTKRPDPAYGRLREMQPAGFVTGSGMDISYRGRLNKYFTGWGRYTWSHYSSNTDGIGFYPQNQYAPHEEWADASWDRRHRVGMYAMVNPEGVLNLSAGIFANTGRPWTETTGTDPYGDGLFNARPDGVQRNGERMPSYADLDLRWGHDFAITSNKNEEAPRLGFSAAAFNVLNHQNASGIATVATSPGFGEVTSVSPPRRIQLGMRFEF
ncbi:MAG TPA: TonB-dependent receptor [Terracidiphilus sp.]|nr:TonB-dependent receptor [Terracidiphilus sp.]